VPHPTSRKYKRKKKIKLKTKNMSQEKIQSVIFEVPTAVEMNAAIF
jgi:hypothetical protein